MSRLTVLALLASQLNTVIAQDYELVKSYNTENFFDEFTFFTGDDPTGGFVDYLDLYAADAAALIRNDSGIIHLGVDSTNAYPLSARGRPIVRVQSIETFTEGLFVIDLAHIPMGCGVWPAFWTVGLGDWPNDGEIENNNAALHAIGTCDVSDSTPQLGSWKSTDCNIDHDGNQGCGVIFPESKLNYGPDFNANGGGMYAMEWTSSTIKIWMWEIGNYPPSLDPNIQTFAPVTPDPSEFGTPDASFGGPCSADFANKFFNHTIIFDTTFCGGWAGSDYGNTWCPQIGATSLSSCNWEVASQPGTYTQAYWDIKSLRVFQKLSSSESPTSPDVPTDVVPAEPTDVDETEPTEPSPDTDVSPEVPPSPEEEPSATISPVSPAVVSSPISKASAVAALSSIAANPQATYPPGLVDWLLGVVLGPGAGRATEPSPASPDLAANAGSGVIDSSAVVRRQQIPNDNTIGGEPVTGPADIPTQPQELPAAHLWGTVDDAAKGQLLGLANALAAAVPSPPPTTAQGIPGFPVVQNIANAAAVPGVVPGVPSASPMNATDTAQAAGSLWSLLDPITQNNLLAMLGGLNAINAAASTPSASLAPGAVPTPSTSAEPGWFATLLTNPGLKSDVGAESVPEQAPAAAGTWPSTGADVVASPLDQVESFADGTYLSSTVGGPIKRYIYDSRDRESSSCSSLKPGSLPWMKDFLSNYVKFDQIYTTLADSDKTSIDNLLDSHASGAGSSPHPDLSSRSASCDAEPYSRAWVQNFAQDYATFTHYADQLAPEERKEPIQFLIQQINDIEPYGKLKARDVSMNRRIDARDPLLRLVGVKRQGKSVNALGIVLHALHTNKTATLQPVRVGPVIVSDMPVSPAPGSLSALGSGLNASTPVGVAGKGVTKRNSAPKKEKRHAVSVPNPGMRHFKTTLTKRDAVSAPKPNPAKRHFKSRLNRHWARQLSNSNDSVNEAIANGTASDGVLNSTAIDTTPEVFISGFMRKIGKGADHIKAKVNKVLDKIGFSTSDTSSPSDSSRTLVQSPHEDGVLYTRDVEEARQLITPFVSGSTTEDVSNTDVPATDPGAIAAQNPTAFLSTFYGKIGKLMGDAKSKTSKIIGVGLTVSHDTNQTKAIPDSAAGGSSLNVDTAEDADIENDGKLVRRDARPQSDSLATDFLSNFYAKIGKVIGNAKTKISKIIGVGLKVSHDTNQTTVIPDSASGITDVIPVAVSENVDEDIGARRKRQDSPGVDGDAPKSEDSTSDDPLSVLDNVESAADDAELNAQESSEQPEGPDGLEEETDPSTTDDGSDDSANEADPDVPESPDQPEGPEPGDGPQEETSSNSVDDSNDQSGDEDGSGETDDAGDDDQSGEGPSGPEDEPSFPSTDDGSEQSGDAGGRDANDAASDAEPNAPEEEPEASTEDVGLDEIPNVQLKMLPIKDKPVSRGSENDELTLNLRDNLSPDDGVAQRGNSPEVLFDGDSMVNQNPSSGFQGLFRGHDQDIGEDREKRNVLEARQAESEPTSTDDPVEVPADSPVVQTAPGTTDQSFDIPTDNGLADSLSPHHSLPMQSAPVPDSVTELEPSDSLDTDPNAIDQNSEGGAPETPYIPNQAWPYLTPGPIIVPDLPSDDNITVPSGSPETDDSGVAVPDETTSSSDTTPVSDSEVDNTVFFALLGLDFTDPNGNAPSAETIDARPDGEVGPATPQFQSNADAGVADNSISSEAPGLTEAGQNIAAAVAGTPLDQLEVNGPGSGEPVKEDGSFDKL